MEKRRIHHSLIATLLATLATPVAFGACATETGTGNPQSGKIDPEIATEENQDELAFPDFPAECQWKRTLLSEAPKDAKSREALQARQRLDDNHLLAALNSDVCVPPGMLAGDGVRYRLESLWTSRGEELTRTVVEKHTFRAQKHESLGNTNYAGMSLTDHMLVEAEYDPGFYEEIAQSSGSEVATWGFNDLGIELAPSTEQVVVDRSKLDSDKWTFDPEKRARQYPDAEAFYQQKAAELSERWKDVLLFEGE